jgi:hypothetical protein
MLEQELSQKQFKRVPIMFQVRPRHLLCKDEYVPKHEVSFEEQARQLEGGEGSSTAGKE